MTANDVFATAAAYLAQTLEDSEDVAPFVPAWLNVLLQECLPVENMLRRTDGVQELAAAPVLNVGTMAETLDYRDALMRIVLPYGLASDMCRDNDDPDGVNEFRSRYAMALEEAQRTEAEAVVDLY